MTNDVLVQLGLPITNYKYENDVLYITDAPALVEGWWKGQVGPKAYYPRNVIIAATEQFNNKDIVCEHLQLPIGKILKAKPIQTGFTIDMAITNKKSIKAILSGDKRGLSIQAMIALSNSNPGFVERIHDVEHVALVANPACAVCNIYSSNIKSGLVSMSEEIIEEDQTTEVEVELAAEVTDLEESPSTEVEMPITEGEITVEEIPEVKVEDQIISETAEVSMSADIKEALITASESITLASAEIKRLTANINDITVSLAAKDVELITTKNELASTKDLVESLNSQINDLKVQLSAVADSERKKIITEIQAIDPDVDTTIMETMTEVQLSAYKSSVEKLAVKGMIVGEKKSVKVDEAPSAEVSLSAHVPTKRDVAASMMTMLLKQQREKK